MNTTTIADARLGVGTGDVTQLRVVRSEWVKLRSLRSTGWTLGSAVLLLVGLGIPLCLQASHHWSPAEVQSRDQDPVFQSLGGLLLAQIPIGVLGVLTVTGEYATGMIRATLGLVPKRLPVLWAKVAVFGLASFTLMLVAALVSFLAGQVPLSNHGVGATLSSPGAARAVLGAAGYLALVGLLGLALGALLRHTAGAVSALLGVLLGLPILFGLLPESWQSAARFLPTLLGEGMASTSPPSVTHQLSPGLCFVVMSVYSIVGLVAAAFVLARRDV
jgi:hypothetical protein